MTDAAVHCLWPAPGDDLDDEDIARLYEMGTVAADGAARPTGRAVPAWLATQAQRRSRRLWTARWPVDARRGPATRHGCGRTSCRAWMARPRTRGSPADCRTPRTGGCSASCAGSAMSWWWARAQCVGRLRRDARGPGIGAVAARARSGGAAGVRDRATLDLDPSAPIFAEAPVRPVVLTVASAPESARRALSAVAEVVDCGDGTHVDTAQMVRRLAERGLKRIHCEGGPHLFGAMVAEGTVDELCHAERAAGRRRRPADRGGPGLGYRDADVARACAGRRRHPDAALSAVVLRCGCRCAERAVDRVCVHDRVA